METSLEIWFKKKKKKLLKEAKDAAIRGGYVDRVHHLKWELRYLLSQEEQLQQQRSKTSWLKDGDQNTRYFHSRVS